MKISFLAVQLILAIFFLMQPNLAEAVAEEQIPISDSAGEDAAPTPMEIQTERTLIGIGTEGYGSPVYNERIAAGEIVSVKSGHFHPFLSVGGFYTDNLFNTNDDEKSDIVAVITPGIWLALPARRQKLLDLNTLNTAPGGLALSRFREEIPRRLQVYGLYRADIREHSEYTEESRVDHRAEASVRGSLRGGLSLEVLNIYEADHDPYGTGATPGRTLDEFTSNLATMTLAYEVTPKVTLKGSYGNYTLNYEDARNDFRNRTDHSLDLYAFYQYSPKTALFLQGEFIDIDYDEEASLDSEEYNYFAGIQFKPSGKTRARFKLGLGSRDYDSSAVSSRDELLVEFQADYFFTPKTSIYLRGYRRVNETDIAESKDVIVTRGQVGYRQRFTAKLRGEAAVHFERNAYDGAITIDGQTDERDDDKFGFVVALGFTPVRWLNASFGYGYTERDSNFAVNDYRSNSFFLRTTAAF